MEYMEREKEGSEAEGMDEETRETEICREIWDGRTEGQEEKREEHWKEERTRGGESQREGKEEQIYGDTHTHPPVSFSYQIQT